MQHRALFVASGILLWLFPVIFTWPILPFKYTFVWILHLLGFEKGRIRKCTFLRDNSFHILSVLPDSYATLYQRRYYGAMIPQYSTFSNFQAAAVLPGVESESEEVALPLYACLLGWVAGILAVRALFN